MQSGADHISERVVEEFETGGSNRVRGGRAFPRSMEICRAVDDGHTLLRAHLEKVRWQLQRYVRRWPERVFSQHYGYSERRIGRHEVMRGFRIPHDGAPREWLDEMGVPSQQRIVSVLSRMDEVITDRLQTLGATVGISLPTEDLRARFNLKEQELELLVAAAAPRLDDELARLYSFCWSDFTIKQPSAAFLCELIAQDSDDARRLLRYLRSDSTLRKFRLVEMVGNERWHPHTPDLHAAVVVPERMISFLNGDTDRSEIPGLLNLGGLSKPVPIPAEPHAALRNGLKARTGRTVVLGPPGVGRTTAARRVAHELGLGVLQIRAVDNMLKGTAQLACREALLTESILVFDCSSLEQDQVKSLVQGNSVRDHPGRLVFTAMRDHGFPASFSRVELPVPDPETATTIWADTLGVNASDSGDGWLAAQMAKQYRLTPAQIEAVVEKASTSTAVPSYPVLLEAARSVLDSEVSWLASPYRVQAELDDVVLPPEVRMQIEEVIADARHGATLFNDWGMARLSPAGRGLSVLFAGPPGTGKTLLAGVLANVLGRALYRVDLSRVVDKYIGETEKNLGRVFDEAERAQAVLLFDEADSLFSNRTSVKSSNDRYANLEVNYLLQRLENYAGVSILTTNFAENLDDAFMRRIRHIIEFPVPDEDARAALWEALLPDSAPVDGPVDFERLAELFEFTGGHIRNAVYRAALRAIDADRSISEDDLLHGALREARELGILVPDGLVEFAGPAGSVERLDG